MGKDNKKHNQTFYINCGVAGAGIGLMNYGAKQNKEKTVKVVSNLEISPSTLILGAGITLLAWSTYKILNQPFNTKEIKHAKKCKKR